MWLLAIIGIMVSLGPAFYDLTRPIRDYLRDIFVMLAKRIRKWFEDYILSTLMRLHNWGFLEFPIYYFCLMFHIQGYRMDQSKFSSLMVAFTGNLFGILAVLYSCTVWFPQSFKSHENLISNIVVWLGVCMIPVSLHFDSSLFAFISV